MYIIREFNLIGGKMDFQYVSSAESKNGYFLLGYDSKKEYALDLSPYQERRAIAQLKLVGCKYKTFEVI